MWRISISVALLMSSTAVQAVPVGKWNFAYGQGVSEYAIQNDAAGSDRFSIACSEDFGTWIGVNVAGTTPAYRTTVTIDVGAEEFTFMADQRGMIRTASHVDDSNFRSLWNDIRRGTIMRVRLQSGQSTTFRLLGAAAVLDRNPCKTDFERM